MHGHTSKQTNKINLHIEAKQLLLVAVVVLLIYVIVPQLGTFHSSLAALRHIDATWAGLAALLYLLTAPASGVLYTCLSLRRLPYGRTVTVQYGSSFANRLLPAGLGALGVGYFYLRKQRLNDASAIAVVTLNNALGLVGHIALLMFLAVMMPHVLSDGLHHLHVNWVDIAVLVAVVAGLVILYLMLSRKVRSITDVVKRTLRQVVNYRRHKLRVAAAFVTSIILTLLYSSSLWASGQALGADFTVAQAVVILAVGVGIGAAVPLPGGLGGAEAGLVAGLLAFGQSPELAIAVAILYRLATYWLGFVVGAAAFMVCRQRRYF